MKLVVIGSGSWGTALAKTASENNEVLVLARREEVANEINQNKTFKVFCGEEKINFTATTCAKTAQNFSENMLLAIPMKFTEVYCKELKERGIDPKIIISVAKGFDIKSKKTASEIIKSVWPNTAVVVLSGPSHSESLIKKAYTAVMIASKDEEALKTTEDIFVAPYFRLYLTKDIKGVELYGAAKNVYSIGSGALDALGLKDNTKSAYITRVIAELNRLGQAFGVKQETIFSLAGLGDLLVTSYSSNSRNYNFGKWLVTQKPEDKPAQIVEGINTVETLISLQELKQVRMPILKRISRVIKKEITPEEAMRELYKGEE